MRTGWEVAVDAVAEGASLARDAAREAWAPLAISAAGWTALFVAGRAVLPGEAASALGWTGTALVALMAAPKLGALHRLAAGEAPGRSGLQWGREEGRLLASLLALIALTLLLLAAWVGVAVPLLIALRPLGQLQLGPVGPVGLGFLLVSPLLALSLAMIADALGRLMVTLAADAAEARPRFARGWLLTRGEGLAPALVLVATVLAPWAALFLLQGALDDLGGSGGGAGRRWSVEEATLAGGALAALAQFVFAPLNAGALRALYLRGRAAERRAVDTAKAVGDKAHPTARPASAAARPEFAA